MSGGKKPALVAPSGMRSSRFAIADDEYLVLSYPIEDDIVLPDSLTDAERAVAVLLLRGMSLRAIAKQRKTSPRTIANQSRSIYRKLGVGSRLELGVALRREGSND